MRDDGGMTTIPMEDDKIPMQGDMIRAGNAGCCCECEMPAQITLDLAGVPLVFARAVGVLQSINPLAIYPHNGVLSDCGVEAVSHIEISQTFWPPTYLYGDQLHCFMPGVLFTQDCSVVLDLTSSTPCEEYIYTGYMPQPPHIPYGYDPDIDEIPCGGELSQLATVRIARECDSVTVGISPPTKDLSSASTATAVASIDAEQISGATLTSGGSGYAIAVMRSAQPTITAAIEGGGGSGAQIAVNLVSLGTEAFSCQPAGYELWAIESFTILNGGSGYSGEPSVSYSIGEGSTLCAIPYPLSVVVAEDGSIESITLEDGGIFWAEELDYVDADSPTVSFGSLVGTGASGNAIVDQSFGSPTFGQVVEVVVTNGGQNYGIAEEAWMATITIQHFSPFPVYPIGITHRDTRYGSEHDQNCYTLISNRVSRDRCPNALVEKVYDMALTWPSEGQDLFHCNTDCMVGAPGTSCDLGSVEACYESSGEIGGLPYTTISGPITGVSCTLSPA